MRSSPVPIMKTKIYSLLYISTALHHFSKDDLLELLAKSRQNNAKLGITGMLLYKGDVFQQVLEGPEDAVKSVFAKISADPRHRGIIKVLETVDDERQFPDWSMGFSDLDSAEAAAVPGYSSFLNTSLMDERFISNPRIAVQLMHVFKKNTAS